MNTPEDFLFEINRMLEHMYSLNEAQYTRVASGDISDLDEFYQSRERILEIIKYLSFELEQIEGESIDKKQLSQLISARKMYLEKIIEIDLKIFGKLDEVKTNLLKEIGENRSTQRVLKAYKSPAAI